MWPLDPAYPEVSPSQIDGKEYDYIVVGGGTAGCCIASRLSEDPNVSVLVLEKGHVKDNFVSRVPLMSQNFWMGDPLQAKRRFTEPMGKVNNRRNGIWTAEGLGGASRINGMLMTRGMPGGYNEWAEKYGLDDWSWDRVEPYFRKSENATLAHGSDAKHRGHDGPIEIRQASSPPFKWTSYLEKAAAQIGLPVHKDYNDPSAPAVGLFTTDMAIDRTGKRASTYRTFLPASVAQARKSHLTICTGAVVSRLDIDTESSPANNLVVKGVYIRPVDSTKNGTQKAVGDSIYVKARREVIISSGTVCTPQILLLSGIGPAEQLARFDIPLVKELPVGAALQDHCSAAIMLELPKSETLTMLESIWGLWNILLWVFRGTGLMSVSATPRSIFFRTSSLDSTTLKLDTTLDASLDPNSASNIPDAEIMIQPVSSFERHVPGYSLITLYPTLVQPFSRGKIELSSRDPLANPKIYHPMLEDPRDLVTFRKAIRFTMRLAEEFALKTGYPFPATLTFAPGVNLDILEEWEKTAPKVDIDTGKGDAPLGYTFASKADESAKKATSTSTIVSEVEATKATAAKRSKINKTWRDVSDAEIDDYVKRVGMGSMHVASTCPMAKDETEGKGVVDQQLKVFGTRNLRIADASVFPKVPSCHTMAPTIMVAERCADFVTRAWRGVAVE
ncbi:hypothetical protein V8F33_011432 [Rhypophila sp. PSN 637]